MKEIERARRREKKSLQEAKSMLRCMLDDAVSEKINNIKLEKIIVVYVHILTDCDILLEYPLFMKKVVDRLDYFIKRCPNDRRILHLKSLF